MRNVAFSRRAAEVKYRRIDCGFETAFAGQGRGQMSPFTLREMVLAGGVLTGLLGAALTVEVVAQHNAAPPDFSLNGAGWIGIGGDFMAVPGGPKPVTFDPAHPFVPNNSGAQPTYRIADLTHPNLKPWVKARMKKDNDEVLAGKIAFTPRSSCMPAGVPGFAGFGGQQPYFFVQSPKKVLMIFSGDQQVRHVYLNVPHTTNPKPSWYGESVGHYDGDTLVVDTIGLNDKTFVDYYRTPHTEKLHVVERWRLIDDGKVLEVKFTVEDPDTYYEPWSAMRRFRRVQQAYLEEVCAENNFQLFDYHIPKAETPDF
jgi:hypothetical protein